jgi:hypothetical protein
MDLICTDGQTIIRTKAVRKISNQINQWDAELIIDMTDGPMDFGHGQVKAKQKFIALASSSSDD